MKRYEQDVRRDLTRLANSPTKIGLLIPEILVHQEAGKITGNGAVCWGMRVSRGHELDIPYAAEYDRCAEAVGALLHQERRKAKSIPGVFDIVDEVTRNG